MLQKEGVGREVGAIDRKWHDERFDGSKRALHHSTGPVRHRKRGVRGWGVGGGGGVIFKKSNNFQSPSDVLPVRSTSLESQI